MSRKRKQIVSRTTRDGSAFIALPWVVVDSPAYKRLSHPARALLIEIARQWCKDNNGRLLCSRAYLKPRGWNSNAVITRAKNELLEAGFIYETVKGQRPNKASWYAVTWYMLDSIAGYDYGAKEGFIRGAYLKKQSLIPSGGAKVSDIAPSNGLSGKPIAPSNGAIRQHFSYSSAPSNGHHLELTISQGDKKPNEGNDEQGSRARVKQLRGQAVTNLLASGRSSVRGVVLNYRQTKVRPLAYKPIIRNKPSAMAA